VLKKSIDSISTVSIAELELTAKLYNMNVLLIPNGFKQLGKKNVQIEKYFLFVGRLVDGKGVDDLIKSFKEIHKLYPSYSLKIVGSPIHSDKYYNKLLLLSNDCESIEFLGNQNGDKLIELYSKAHLVVLPSESESFSIVALEALYYNGALLCSDIPQFRLLLTDYVSFMNLCDVKDIKKNLEKSIVDKSFCIELRNKSKNFEFQKYNWSYVSSLYENLYIKVYK